MIIINISKNTFLYSYALFLVFCLFLAFFDSSGKYINRIISAIAIVSAVISFVEIFYTKILIDRKVRIQLVYLYNLSIQKCEKLENEILEKYKGEYKKSEKNINLLNKVFGEDNVSMMLNDKRYLQKNKEKIFNKISEVLENEKDVKVLKSFIEQWIKSDDIDIFEENEEDVLNINSGLEKAKRKENIKLKIINIAIILGFAIFIVVLMIDNFFKQYTTLINNFLTVFAFLSVILNMIVKDNYKKKLRNELNETYKELLAE